MKEKKCNYCNTTMRYVDEPPEICYCCMLPYSRTDKNGRI